MNYTMKKIEENIALMEMDNGCSVKIIFRKEDNPDIENIVTENLLTSYERRMSESMGNLREIQ